MTSVSDAFDLFNSVEFPEGKRTKTFAGMYFYTALAMFDNGEPITTATISDYVGSSSNSASEYMAFLSDAGLITRVRIGSQYRYFPNTPEGNKSKEDLVQSMRPKRKVNPNRAMTVAEFDARFEAHMKTLLEEMASNRV